MFLETEDKLTIRARVPRGSALERRTDVADFVMARKDGTYTDGRRPDTVEPGSLEDDLRRRDFTINAMALDEDGSLIDLFGGRNDLIEGTLRFVGRAEDRIEEDGLRVIRGLRFMVTKGMTPSLDTFMALKSPESALALGRVSIERIANELSRMFQFDTIRSLRVLGEFPVLHDAMFRGQLHLTSSLTRV